MRIVRFSSPQTQPIQFQNQKISLSKLTQTQTRSNVQYNQ